MPAGQNAVPGKQGFQTTGRPAAELPEVQLLSDGDAVQQQRQQVVLDEMAARARDLYPDAAYLEIADSYTEDDDVHVSRVLDADGNGLHGDSVDDDELGDMAMEFTMAELTRHPGVEWRGGRDNATFRLKLKDDAPATAPEPPATRPIGAKGGHAPSIAGELARLRLGQKVRMHKDGRDLDLEVTREFQREPGGFGSSDYGTVSVGYGPGRWNTEINGAGISAGFQNLSIVEGD